MAGMGMPDMAAMAAGLGRGGKSTKTRTSRRSSRRCKKRSSPPLPRLRRCTELAAIPAARWYRLWQWRAPLPGVVGVELDVDLFAWTDGHGVLQRVRLAPGMPGVESRR